MANTRQARRPAQSGDGKAVDIFGGPAIDPTENVLALVDVESKYREMLRIADTRYQDSMREAETRRVDQLAAQKQTFDLKLADVLQASQDAASLLLATQLKEVKSDLQTELRSLNQFRWESGGRGTGRSDVVAWIVSGLMFVVAVAAIVADRF